MANKRRGESVARHLDEVRLDDELLTSLSKGIDPSSGADPLAAMFLNMREEITATTPAAPNLADFGFDLDAPADPELLRIDAAHAPTDATPSAGDHAAGEAEVVPLRRRRVSAVASGLIGAAAATLVIAGGGAMIYSASPDSPLYGVNQAMFGTEDTVVRLAGKLDAADSLSARGDVEGAQQILDEARDLLATLSDRQRAAAEADLARMQYTLPPATEVRVTTTESVSAEPPAPQTVVETVTQVVTETNVVTVTVPPASQASNVSAAPTTPAEHPVAPQEPSTPQQ